jgi:hypothetical protein
MGRSLFDCSLSRAAKPKNEKNLNPLIRTMRSRADLQFHPHQPLRPRKRTADPSASLGMTKERAVERERTVVEGQDRLLGRRGTFLSCSTRVVL